MNRKHSAIMRHCVLSAVTVCAAMSALADAITWEGSTNLVMTAATTVEVPAGRTNVIEELSGAYALTKTGGGTLEIRYVKTATASVVVSEGLVRFANPRPDDLFARAYFHVDASDLSSMVIETVNGTNFVTRWNDVDGRTDRYATHCRTVWNCRTDPDNRKPFLRHNFQNGLPVMDFGTLLTTDNTNELGQAIGYGAAMRFDQGTPYIKEGFTVASDTEDYYEPTSRGNGMSFFSCETAYRFVRCSADPSSGTYLGIMGDNAQNNDYFRNGRSVWYDGTILSSHPKWTTPSAGFHIYRIRPSADGNTTFNSFAAEYNSSKSRSYGGQRIAEYVLFTNRTETGESSMTTNEATVVNRYLRVKWFAQKISRVTVAEDASLDVDPSANLAIQTLKDCGAADLLVESCVTNQIPFFDAIAHLDASRTDTMTITTQNGTNFVSRWNDADGGPRFVVSEDTTGAGGQRRNPENRLPFINPLLTQNGLPVIDLGSAMFRDITNETGAALGYGAAFRFDGFPDIRVAEYMSVISDTEDLKTAQAKQYGPCYISYRSKASSFDGSNPGRRGQTVSGKNPALFYKVSSNYNITCQNGTNYVNGVKQAYTYNPPDGFNIINIRPTSAILCNLIGRHVRNAGSNRADTYGGQRIAEYMIFDQLLSEAKRERIYRALRTKWYGDAPVTTNFYGRLSLGEKAVMTVGYDEFLAVTNKLTIAGTLSATSVSAAEIAVAGASATVDGALTLADGATLSFTRLPDGSWTSLSTTSVETEGNVTVSLSGNLKGLAGTSARLIATDNPPVSLNGWATDFVSTSTQARLVLKADGVWIEFLSPGLVILVK